MGQLPATHLAEGGVWRMTFLDDYLLSLFPEDEDECDRPQDDDPDGEEGEDGVPFDERWPRRPQ